MQDARREALAARLHKERMALWNQDLDRVTAYVDGTTVQAALLLGFAFAAYSGAADGIQKLKKGCVTVGAFTYVICMGQLTTILGPLLALKGPDGSMERALIKMKKERFLLFQMFSLGLIGYYLMLLALTWLNIIADWASTLCTVVLTLFFIFITLRARHMFISFSYEGKPLKRIIEASSDVDGEFHVGREAEKATLGPMQGDQYLRETGDAAMQNAALFSKSTPTKHVYSAKYIADSNRAPLITKAMSHS